MSEPELRLACVYAAHAIAKTTHVFLQADGGSAPAVEEVVRVAGVIANFVLDGRLPTEERDA